MWLDMEAWYWSHWEGSGRTGGGRAPSSPGTSGTRWCSCGTPVLWGHNNDDIHKAISAKLNCKVYLKSPWDPNLELVGEGTRRCEKIDELGGLFTQVELRWVRSRSQCPKTNINTIRINNILFPQKSGLHGQNALLQTVSNSMILIRLLHSDIELCIFNQ